MTYHRSLSTHGRSLIGSAVRWIGSEDSIKPGRRGSRRLRPIVWALEERLANANELVDAQGDVVLRQDADGRVTHASAAAAALIGKKPSELAAIHAPSSGSG